MALLSTITAMYYNVIIAWVFHYLFGSWRSHLVWGDCTNEWNDDSCIIRGKSLKSFVFKKIYFNFLLLKTHFLVNQHSRSKTT